MLPGKQVEPSRSVTTKSVKCAVAWLVTQIRFDQARDLASPSSVSSTNQREAATRHILFALIVTKAFRALLFHRSRLVPSCLRAFAALLSRINCLSSAGFKAGTAGSKSKLSNNFRMGTAEAAFPQHGEHPFARQQDNGGSLRRTAAQGLHIRLAQAPKPPRQARFCFLKEGAGRVC